jgi:predicted HTH domain antitoxin
MSRPTTIRVPEELLNEVDEQARRTGCGRAATLRHLLQRGLREEKTAAALMDYEAGRLSAGQVCRLLDLSPWEFPDLLKARGMRRNVTLEDWLDSDTLSLGVWHINSNGQ